MSFPSKFALLALLAAGLGYGGYHYLHHRHDDSAAPASEASKTDSATTQRPPVNVKLATIEQHDVPILFNATGHVTPLVSVEVRPQVAGVIASIHFREGDVIKVGQTLFKLNDAAEQASLVKARAQLERDKTQLTIAQRTLARNQSLVAQNFIAPSALDTLQANVDSLQGAVQVDQAALVSAQVDLSYKTIKATVNGRAGAVDIKPGSLVQPTMTTPMVIISQLDPVAITYTLPESSLEQLFKAKDAGTLQVSVKSGNGKTLTGKLFFIDNTVDASTGTIKLKAQFDNPAQALWPGSFINVTTQAGIRKNALTVPATAILNGPDGRFIYVQEASADGTQIVMPHPVSLTKVQDGNAIFAALKNDVQVGQAAVIEGGINLRKGDRINTGSQTNSNTVGNNTSPEARQPGNASTVSSNPTKTAP